MKKYEASLGIYHVSGMKKSVIWKKIIILYDATLTLSHLVVYLGCYHKIPPQDLHLCNSFQGQNIFTKVRHGSCAQNCLNFLIILGCIHWIVNQLNGSMELEGHDLLTHRPLYNLLILFTVDCNLGWSFHRCSILLTYCRHKPIDSLNVILIMIHINMRSIR